MEEWKSKLPHRGRLTGSPDRNDDSDREGGGGSGVMAETGEGASEPSAERDNFDVHVVFLCCSPGGVAQPYEAQRLSTQAQRIELSRQLASSENHRILRTISKT